MNNAPIRRIKLGGVLGKKFVKEFTYRARDVPHAIRALKGQFPGFERFMLEAKQKGLTFAVFVGKKNVAKEEIDMTKGSDDIRIVPVIIGSKRGGLFQTILGAALIAVAAYFTGGAALGFGAGFASAGAWGTAALVGGSMLLGGVVQLLSPQPGGLSVSQSAENKPSYAFGGPVNSTAQGNPVGVLWGEREIGGAVISAGVYAEDQQ
ncbi:tail assembly protein [Serratia oryzae]|uniref:tail assembly protein n=1 Tax=Serratia oryzae TaxID=2034155 RepID=UPI0012E234C6|nr:tail assembly protein [Serratia oryzae]VXD06454.1 Tail assembly protein [Enterobacterales bacterium 8AC]